MHFNLPDDVLFILNELRKSGYEAFTVGGCVRDGLMGITPKDWDIASSASPPEVKRVFPHTVDTGIRHGTVTVLIDRRHYEVTTYRIDGVYLDGRRPSSVTFTRHIQDDLSRRDFTMNAIAYHPDTGYLDPFDGRADIQRRLIRCVGHAEHRFNEDALRMLRAIRFAGQLGFSIEPDTLNAIPLLKANLAHVSAERIREELTRLLASPNPDAVLLLEQTGMLPFVTRGYDFMGDLTQIAAQLRLCPKEIPMLMALYLAWAGDDARAILRALCFDNKTIRETAVYIQWLPIYLDNTRYAVKQMLCQISPEYAARLLALKTIARTQAASELSAIRAMMEDILLRGECYTLKDLAVTGNDLIETGIPRGETTGQALDSLLHAVMREPALNHKPALLALAADRFVR